ncbi:MAG: protein kinase [Planctomycetota bacterium]|nr:protein kinase [Planctomycetota bacterium]
MTHRRGYYGKSHFRSWFVFESSIFPTFGVAANPETYLPMDQVELPDRIGPYDIIRKVGAGGMGTVYLGRHVDSQLEAAVKVLSASLAREPGTVERFEREIDAMRQLTGPHIVKLFESGHDLDTDQMYFAMEYVEGQTLADCIRSEHRLSWDRSVDIAIQVCAALKTAHASGVVHRDLKPSNLLIGNDGIVKLTDFGVAQVFAAQRLTVTGGIIGTAEYMSPEQAQGRRCTRTSDLYSLGAVLYVMLTGRPPFTGKNAVEIIQKHSTARFDRPGLYVPDLPRILEDVVCKLLEKKPEDRYSDAHVVSLRLKEVVKRVELANKDETIARPLKPDSLMSRTAAAPSRSGRTGDEPETLAAAFPLFGGRSADSEIRSERQGGPGPATLMRDAFRAEISRQHEKSAVGTLFDNTWFLVACLILLIVGGFFWINLIGQVETANDSVELVAEDADSQSEIARFLRLAKSYRRSGDTPRERQILKALRNVIADDESNAEAIEEIDQRLEMFVHLRGKQADAPSLATQSLDRATQLIKAGNHEEASQLLDSIAVLYGDDQDARTIIERLTELRMQIVAAAATAAENSSSDQSNGTSPGKAEER